MRSLLHELIIKTKSIILVLTAQAEIEGRINLEVAQKEITKKITHVLIPPESQ